MVVACLTLLVGCRMGAPLHVWSPPALKSTVGKSVLVPKLVGPPELAAPIREKLLRATPTDAGRSTRLIAAEAAGPASSDHGVALVSYDENDESDLALADTARQQNYDFILRGEIMPDRRPKAITEVDNQLIVSWRLMPVTPQQQADSVGESSGRPVMVELDSALQDHPDLRLATDPTEVLQTALIRDTLPLFTPTVQRDHVELEVSYMVPGSRAIRRANSLAAAGLWSQAESIWNEVRSKYPLSSVAVHNLAIASVAKQDYSTARRLASKAIRMKPSKLHQETLVWVERKQRAFHEAFQLPDPPEGWFVTRSTATPRD